MLTDDYTDRLQVADNVINVTAASSWFQVEIIHSLSFNCFEITAVEF